MILRTTDSLGYNKKLILILTFSFREKELPLPLGEGWDEGLYIIFARCK